MKRQCHGYIRIFGEICANKLLLIHKLLLRKITITRTVKETVALHFPGSGRKNLRNFSLTLFCRVRDVNGRFPFTRLEIYWPKVPRILDFYPSHLVT